MRGYVDVAIARAQVENIEAAGDAHRAVAGMGMQAAIEIFQFKPAVAGREIKLAFEAPRRDVAVTAHPGSQLREAWEIRTSDGGVRVAIPGDLAADIELHTTDGHITTNIPITVEGNFGSHDLHGKMNGGGNRLTIHTSDGSVTLDKS